MGILPWVSKDLVLAHIHEHIDCGLHVFIKSMVSANYINILVSSETSTQLCGDNRTSTNIKYVKIVNYLNKVLLCFLKISCMHMHRSMHRSIVYTTIGVYNHSPLWTAVYPTCRTVGVGKMARISI